MSGGAKRKVYLDTNVLLDWLAGNQERASGTHDVGGLVKATLDNEIIAVTSLLTRLEILECAQSPTMWKAWQKFQARKNVTVAPVSVAITNVAHEIRNYYAAEKRRDTKLKSTCSLPDAVHVATAIVFTCDLMVTFDGGEKDKKRVSPLDMNGKVAGKWPLQIELPNASTKALNL